MPESLSVHEREMIYACLVRDEDVSWAELAREVGRHPTSLSREVALNGGRGSYSPSAAQARAAADRRRPKAEKLLDPVLAERVRDELEAGFSPAGAARRLAAEGIMVSHETIYRGVYSGLVDVDPKKCLRTGRPARRRRKKDLTTNPTGNYLGEYRPIHTRPAAVEERVEVGHWEGDLIVGEGSRSAMITLYERVTRLTHLIALPLGKASRHVTGAVGDWLCGLPLELRRTLTWDQGSEMARWADIDPLFTGGIFFADKHAPWQRGGNEQNNRSIRFWFPKGTSLADVTGQQINQALYVLNNQPRRSLAWLTPNQAYHHHIRAVTG